MSFDHKRIYDNHSWSIKVEHYLKTLKKKPGAFHASTARYQMAPKLQNIYNKYYINNTKDFIDLIEIIKKNSFDEVINAIEKLEKISKNTVTTDAIKVVLSRDEKDNKELANSKSSEIEEKSEQLIQIYTDFLNKEGIKSFKKGGVI